jgi:hypothetical protein
LVMLFIEALTEPFRGWVKHFKLHTLQEAIVCTRDMFVFEFDTDEIRKKFAS